MPKVQWKVGDKVRCHTSDPSIGNCYFIQGKLYEIINEDGVVYNEQDKESWVHIWPEYLEQVPYKENKITPELIQELCKAHNIEVDANTVSFQYKNRKRVYPIKPWDKTEIDPKYLDAQIAQLVVLKHLLGQFDE